MKAPEKYRISVEDIPFLVTDASLNKRDKKYFFVMLIIS